MKSKTIATISAFLIGALIGFFLKGSFFTPAQTPAKVEQDSHLKEKVQALSDKEIAEYYELKNDTERLKKADEILAKMLTIFLHDLGVKLSQQTLRQSAEKASVSQPQTTASDQMLSAGAQTKSSSDQNKVDTATTGWKTVERFRHDIKSETDSADFLEKVKIPDFDDALKDAKAFGNRAGNLPYLRGQFIGKADVKLEEKYQTWDVDISVNGSLDKGNFKGKADIKMSKNGKIFSNSSDGGDLRSFKEFSSGSDSILIRASPTIYFQMYFLRGNDALIGNVYSRNEEEDPYHRIGTVQVKRTN